jgi:hypothetical protein
MTGQFCLRFRLPRKSQGDFTCHKSATWGKRLHFPSEGRHAEDFFALLRPGLNPRTRVPEDSMLTTWPPRPLSTVYSSFYWLLCSTKLGKELKLLTAQYTSIVNECWILQYLRCSAQNSGAQYPTYPPDTFKTCSFITVSTCLSQ